MTKKESKFKGCGDDKRERAYKVGAKITRERMKKEAPLDDEALGSVEASDVIVVEGSYDRVENVLSVLELPYTLITAGQLDRVALGPHQILVINCPGNVSARATSRIREFVEEGGSLFTTDWALKHVIEPAFPGILAFNNHPTADDVVRIEVKNKDNRFLDGVIDSEDEPLWWLEGSSYPIQVLAPENVEVLITSKELKKKYGEAPVAVYFRYGEGEVFHMISHYYLQRTELRSARHQETGATYATSKGVSATMFTDAELDGLQVGDVESAASSARLFANVIASKKRAYSGKKKENRGKK